MGVEPTDDLSVRRGLNAVAKPFAYLPMAEEEGVESLSLVLTRQASVQEATRLHETTALPTASGPSLRVAQK